MGRRYVELLSLEEGLKKFATDNKLHENLKIFSEKEAQIIIGHLVFRAKFSQKGTTTLLDNINLTSKNTKENDFAIE